MANIEIVIKIPEEAKQAFDCAESNDLKGCYYDHGGVIGNAIKNGTPLPKGHGRLIDADELKTTRTWALVAKNNASQNEISFAPLMCILKEDIDNATTIIEADKETENESAKSR